MRARWTTSIDVRTQTEYGTLRAYSRAGFQTTTGETTQGRIYTERGFIQFAGFTFGKSQSYFDFFGGAFCYGCSYTGAASMTGAAGTLLAAYTATFGNGFTATISLEDNFIRRNAIWDASNDATNALVIGNMPGPAIAQDSYNVAPVNHGDSAAVGIPDIVGSLRVDQAWGSAQIAGALHQLRAGYYGNNTTGAGANVLGVNTAFLAPNDAYGWAVMAGIVINLPWAKGDKFHVEAAFSEGAGAYVGLDGGISGKNNNFSRFNGAQRGPCLGDRLGLRQSRVDERGDRPAADPVLLDPGGDRALLDSGVCAPTSGATTRRRTTTTLRRRCSVRRRRARSAVWRLRTPRSRVPRWWQAATRTSPAGRSAYGRSGIRHRSSMSASKCTTRRSRPSLTRAWSRSTSRAAVAVRWVSTSRRTAKCGARSSACSATSGHDRLIIAGSSKEPPVARPGVFRLPPPRKLDDIKGASRGALAPLGSTLGPNRLHAAPHPKLIHA